MANQIIIEDKLDTMNHLLGSMVRQKMSEAAEVDLEEVAKNVRRGIASEIYDIGDQIIVPWTDTNGTEYQVPFDIVHFGEATLEYGDVVPAMYLQSHYAFPNGVQFDQNEALYYCSEALAAGTYYFTCGESWGSYIVKDKSYCFTLTKDVPKGGQVQIGAASSEIGYCPDKSPDNWRIRTYESSTSTATIEIVELTEGTDGTSLGTWSLYTKYANSGINNMARSSYGYNRWSQSAIRQYLNSTKDKGNWWAPKNNYDRPPIELAALNGFMKGFGEDFLSVIKPIKITSVLNTLSDSAIGTSEDTYDTFFLASLRNENIKEELEGVEGDVWEYWRRATSWTKIPQYHTGAAPITYAMDNHASAQSVRLRSANRGSACSTWVVYASGYVSSYGNATASNRFAPACAIC